MFLSDAGIARLSILQHDYYFNIVSIKSNSLTVVDSYQFAVTVITEQALSLNTMLNQQAKLILNKKNYFYGVITNIYYKKQDALGFHYQIDFESLLSPLKYFNEPRVFTNQSVIEIIETVLKRYPHLKNHHQFLLSKTYSQKEMVIQYKESDYQFLQRLLLENQLFFIWKQRENHYQFIISDDVLKTRERLPLQKKLLAKKISLKNDLLTVLTNDLDVYLCQRIMIDCSEQIIKSRQYYVKAIIYKIDSTGGVKNQVLLAGHMKEGDVPHYHWPSFHYAVLKSKEETAIIDRYGCYRVQYLFAGSRSNISKPIYHSALFSNVEWGQHFGYYANSEVLIVDRFNRTNDPFIFGILNNSISKNPVTCSTACQLKLISYAGHAIQFGDKEDKTFLMLQTFNKNQAIRFRKNNPAFLLENKRENICVYSGHKFRCHSDESLQINADNYNLLAKQKILIKTKNGKIQYNAKECFSITAGSFSISSHQKINISSTIINFFAKQSIKIITAKKLNCAAQSFNFNIGQTIRVDSTEINLKGGASTMNINNGCVRLQGQSIQIITLS